MSSKDEAVLLEYADRDLLFITKTTVCFLTVTSLITRLQELKKNIANRDHFSLSNLPVGPPVLSLLPPEQVAYTPGANISSPVPSCSV
jgi:hypothetical protein